MGVDECNIRFESSMAISAQAFIYCLSAINFLLAATDVIANRLAHMVLGFVTAAVIAFWLGRLHYDSFPAIREAVDGRRHFINFMDIICVIFILVIGIVLVVASFDVVP